MLKVVARYLAAVFWFFGLGALISTASAEIYKPLKIGPQSRLTFPADARLNLVSGGTIELWIAATADTDNLQCVMLHGDGGEHSFAIVMDPGRKAIHLDTPQGTFSALADFSDGQYHHVVFWISGGVMSSLVDGKAPVLLIEVTEGEEPEEAPPVALTFGHAGIDGLPLHLGCARADSEEEVFQGWLASFRVWNRRLDESSLNWSKQYYGLPQIKFDETFWQPVLDNNLIAYGQFTDKRKSLFYTEPALRSLRSPLARQGDDAYVPKRRIGLSSDVRFGDKKRRLAALHARFSNSRITDIRFEYALEGGVSLFLPQDSNWTSGDQAELERLAGLAADPSAVSEFTSQQLISKAHALQMSIDPHKASDAGRFADLNWVTQKLKDDEYITGVVGVHNTDAISELRFRTNQQWLPMIPGDLTKFPSPPAGSEVFNLAMPMFAEFEGIDVSRIHDGNLHTIALLYSQRPVPEDQKIMVELTGGLWVEADACEPRINDEMAYVSNHSRPIGGVAGLHGLYTTPTVVKFQYDEYIRTLIQWTDWHLSTKGGGRGKSGGCGATQVGGYDLYDRWYQRAGFAKDNTLSGAWGNPFSIRIRDSGKLLMPFAGGRSVPGPFVRVKTARETSKDKIAWGGTFALPHRPANVRSNFVGYDITHLNPHNYLKSHGIKKEVFEYPDENSTDYQTTDNNLIVPRGVFFKSNVSGSEEGHTVMAAGEGQYGHAWSVSLGFNLGFGFAGIGASYSANASYRRKAEDRQRRQVITSITRTTSVRYAIVTDRSRIKLSREFRNAILKLRDQHLIGRVSSLGKLIRQYGTHYAYAVTYGGMAFLETDFSEEVVAHMREREMAFEEESKVSFTEESKSNGCGCGDGGGGASGSLGASASTSSDVSTRNQLERSDQSHVFGTYGGSVSRGEGWTLAAGQEVPILFDMRPLDELLSPIFFDDPIIWEELKPVLHAEIEAYLKRAAARGIKTPPAWFNKLEDTLVKNEPRVFDHGYRYKGDE